MRYLFRPALICLSLNKKADNEVETKQKAIRSPKIIVPIIFASLGIIMGAAYVNSIMAAAFDISGSIMPVDTPIDLTQFLLNTVTVALVPAFCEEFLFRKTILSALSPYGEGFAIISSAVLFGLMHQNVLQIFYATMAGIVIGYVYLKTRSFLCVFLIHFTNNFVSVIQQSFESNFREEISILIETTMTLIILLTGIISVLVLMIRESYNKKIYIEEAFESIQVPSVNFRKYEISSSPTRKFFSSPTVIIFTIISLLICLTSIYY